VCVDDTYGDENGEMGEDGSPCSGAYTHAIDDG